MNKKNSKKFNINYILKNYFELIVLILVPTIIIVGLLVLIVPNYNSIKLQLQSVIDLEGKYSDLKISHIKDLKNYQENFNNISEEEKNKIKKILPEEKDTEIIINEINQISKKIGVDISSIIFINNTRGGVYEEEKNNIEKISFSISIKNGKDYQTFKKFINEIENNIRIFDVEDFYVDDKFDTYNFKVNCYYKNI